MFKGLAGIIIILAYALIACQLFITILEFYLFSLCAMMLIPFSVFRPTSWLGERAIGAVFAVSMKMMVLGLVISLAYNTLKTLNLPVDCDVKEVCVLMVIARNHSPSLLARPGDCGSLSERISKPIISILHRPCRNPTSDWLLSYAQQQQHPADGERKSVQRGGPQRHGQSARGRLPVRFLQTLQ